MDLPLVHTVWQKLFIPLPWYRSIEGVTRELRAKVEKEVENKDFSVVMIHNYGEDDNDRESVVVTLQQKDKSKPVTMDNAARDLAWIREVCDLDEYKNASAGKMQFFGREISKYDICFDEVSLNDLKYFNIDKDFASVGLEMNEKLDSGLAVIDIVKYLKSPNQEIINSFKIKKMNYAREIGKLKSLEGAVVLDRTPHVKLLRAIHSAGEINQIFKEAKDLHERVLVYNQDDAKNPKLSKLEHPKAWLYFPPVRGGFLNNYIKTSDDCIIR